MRRRGKMVSKTGMRRIDLIEQNSNLSEVINDQDEDNKVLHVSGGGNQPFMIKGKINNEPFDRLRLTYHSIHAGRPEKVTTVRRNLRKINAKNQTIRRPQN